MAGPVIGITTYDDVAGWRGWSERASLLPYEYVTSVREAGGRPVLLPPGGSPAEARATVAGLDGLIVTGGPDVDPARYGAEPHPSTSTASEDRDIWDLAVTASALELGVPLLGICRGMQVLNVCRGGTLHQHLPDLTGHEEHSGPDTGYGSHPVRVAAGSLLESATGAGWFPAPTHHHQAIDLPGAGLTPVAWAEDGMIEAVEGDGAGLGGFVLGVQWHPEQGTDPSLFQALIGTASGAVIAPGRAATAATPIGACAAGS